MSTPRARGGGPAVTPPPVPSGTTRAVIVKSITADQAKAELSRLVRQSVKGHETFQLLTIAVAPDVAPTVPTTVTHRGTGSVQDP